LQREWRKVFDAERRRIAAGQRLPVDRPPVTIDLMPRGFSLDLNDGSIWPDWRKIPAK
jgi:hypothetical protein